jgi:hypothetical protein
MAWCTGRLALRSALGRVTRTSPVDSLGERLVIGSAADVQPRVDFVVIGVPRSACTGWTLWWRTLRAW